ncbi:MAG: hypothetical protein H6Q17_1321 [Bacteroidetes bacterium]|nr:hypothetical protein [Bacteroidota bacterium]
MIKKNVFSLIFLLFIGLYALPTNDKQHSNTVGRSAIIQEDTTTSNDVISLHFPVKHTDSGSENKLTDDKYPMDLRDPNNLKSTVFYDPVSGLYLIYTKVGNMDIATPISMTQEEYKDYTLRTSMQSYWKQRNDSTIRNEDSKFKFTDMKFSLGPADKLFGPGGVQVKIQGSTELDFGVTSRTIQNPTYSYKLQHPSPAFDFTEKIQLNVNGKVGDKVNLNMNYNSESSFDYDQKAIQLGYTGKSDEIIKKIEVGNVSLPLNSSLITGSSALFGIKTELQFGKLNVVAVASQQQSQTQTVSSKGGVQTTKFNIAANNYDVNRHFFLSQYFRNNFERWMNNLPYITSGIIINKVEVWVTNKRSDYSQARNINAFADLGEQSNLTNSHWSVSSSVKYPCNKANSLYKEVTALGIRDIQTATSTLESTYNNYGMNGGIDYEQVESARKLDSTEYILNKKLGYISLKSALNSDEILGIAYSYTANGTTYQVGEFSTDGITSPNTLTVKLLKNSNLSPAIPLWKLMMKNVYCLGASQMQKTNFKLNVMYENDSTGINVAYINEGSIKGQTLIKVLNVDKLDSHNEAHSDGVFDYVEGYTALSDRGFIIFPQNEPFGSYLAGKIGNNTIAKKYIFQEMYDSTQTVAQQSASKNRFYLSGQYKGTSSTQIQLNATSIPRGSVVVTAAGQTLVENQDYTVDYNMGTVTIINQSIIAAGTDISVKLENQSMFDLQRKTLVGTHLEYAFSKDFSLGATFMHLSELPLTTKVAYGSDPISNSIWGLNTSYRTEMMWLTDLMNKIPMLNLTKPVTLSLNAEFANLIAGHSSAVTKQGTVYLDDFESSSTSIDISYPYNWFLSSTPADNSSSGLFPEAALTNDINYGKNRALVNWFVIDKTIFSGTTSNVPSYIRTNKNLQSNHLTRPVLEQEIFPNKESTYGTTSYLSVLNLSYYPTQKGPYNLDVHPSSYSKGVDINGTLLQPRTRWGGIMRKLETTNFETANIQYIDFWLMDPFVNDTAKTNTGGDLYFNLGDISEDILKDGKKFFENGLSATGDTTNITRTVWGHVPTTQSSVLAFDNSSDSRQYQDVGLDGLSTANEFAYSSYKNYLTELKATVSSATLSKWQSDPFSPLNDPAGDNFRHYRNSNFDTEQAPILERYKRYNGIDGNSTNDNSSSSYSSTATSVPDVEDINQDNTLNKYENYYQYKVSLRRTDMVVGSNYIIDQITPTVTMPNGSKSSVSWYHFKVPIREYTKKVGSISGFTSIRFMRMFLTNFSDSAFLRFGTLNLTRGEWRTYTQKLYSTTSAPSVTGTLSISSINIEDDATKTPVNYVLPPGVTRQVDPTQLQTVEENEQSLSLKTENLACKDSRAVYKATSFDMRQYKHLHMFTHAEKLTNDITNLKDYELSVFIRLGDDYTNNYYEYEVPLKLTAAGTYNANSSSDRLLVWPSENELNVALSVFTKIKKQRNTERNTNSTVSLTTLYSYYDPSYPKNKVSIIGNPSLADVQGMMIGIRNNGQEVKSAEVWVDELSLNDFNEGGGWAGTATASIGLSDLGTINLYGKFVTAGFGSIEQTLMERSLDNDFQYSFSTNLQLGKFFPEKAHVSIPFYFSHSDELVRPKYNPLDEDELLADALKTCTTVAERDSILSLVQTRHITNSFNITNAKVDIRSKNPKLYDPANFSLSFSYNRTDDKSPEYVYSYTKDYSGTFNYSYSNTPTPWQPFKNSKTLQSPLLKLIGDFNLNLMPSLIAYNSNITRTYTQSQERDYDALEAGTTQSKYDLLSYSKDFLWNRKFDFKLDLTKSLSLSFSSTTNSRIDESDGPVDANLFPDEYKVWKNAIKKSITDLGRPLLYQQVFNATYTLPLNKLPYLDFINTKVQYTANYEWQTGVTTASNLNVGNTISSTAQTQVDAQFNFEMFYNKIKFLSKIAKKSASVSRNTSFIKKNFKQNLTLTKNKTEKIFHKLNTTKFTLAAIDTLGNPIHLQYKIIDSNTISVSSNQSIKTTVYISSQIPVNNTTSKSMIEYAARTLMMIRRGSFSYRYSQNLTLPEFTGTSKWFGQSSLTGSTAPGLGFAFGFFDQSYINKALNKGWLITNDTVINPATYATTKNFEARLSLEPLPHLKIDLAQQWYSANENSIEFMYEGMPTTSTGSFHMSYIAIGTFFRGVGNASNNYSSATYRNFKANQAKVSQLIEQKYAGQRYPSSGFLTGSALAGTVYDSSNGNISSTSADVLIPAFLSAYSGRSVSSGKLGLIPSLLQSLPNWRITYDGLSSFPLIASHFKAFTLNHAYTCTYTISSYSSYSNWVSNGVVGFKPDVTSGNPIPSSQYDISSVSITEAFAPLIGLDAVLKNSLSTKLEFQKQRTETLNISSSQLVEVLSNEWVFGLGYTIKDFNVILKLKSRQSKVKNNLTLKSDLSVRNSKYLLRNIVSDVAQATDGGITATIKISADYVFNSRINFKFYYDRTMSNPLISTSYPMSTTDFGVAIKLLLTK